MHKWVGAVLQMAAAGMLVASGEAGSFALLIPGIITGMGGLWAWGYEGGMQIAPPKAQPDRELLDSVERMQHALEAMQDDVARLGDDREFYRELYSGETTRQPAPPISGRG